MEFDDEEEYHRLAEPTQPNPYYHNEERESSPVPDLESAQKEEPAGLEYLRPKEVTKGVTLLALLRAIALHRVSALAHVRGCILSKIDCEKLDLTRELISSTPSP
jgi:hypothetical protein